MDPGEIGDISVAMVTAALLRARYVVLKPFGERHRYDLVIESDGKFERVQCKTGRIRNNAVEFKACSNGGRMNLPRRHYHNEADLFGVYCPDNDRSYLVPVKTVGKTEGRLRIEKPRRLDKRIHYADDYLILPTPLPG